MPRLTPTRLHWMLVAATIGADVLGLHPMAWLCAGGCLMYMALDWTGYIAHPGTVTRTLQRYGTDRHPVKEAILRDACTDITPQRARDLKLNRD